MKDRWTDDRLDDLNDKVGDLGRRMDNGFNRVDADIRGLRGEMNSRFDAMQDRFDSRFDLLQSRFDARFDALQRVLIQFAGVMVAALISVIATLIATQV